MRTYLTLGRTVLSRTVAIASIVVAVEMCTALLVLSESTRGSELGLFAWVESADVALAVVAGIVWHAFAVAVTRGRSSAARGGSIECEPRGGKHGVGHDAGVARLPKSGSLDDGGARQDVPPFEP